MGYDAYIRPYTTCWENLVYYARKNDYWVGLDKYGDKIPDRPLVNNDIVLGWLLDRESEVVNTPIFEKKEVPWVPRVFHVCDIYYVWYKRDKMYYIDNFKINSASLPVHEGKQTWGIEITDKKRDAILAAFEAIQKISD